MPAHPQPVTEHYDLYPAFHLAEGQIHLGFNALAERIREHKKVIIDGTPIMVVKAFVKSEWFKRAENRWLVQ